MSLTLRKKVSSDSTQMRMLFFRLMPNHVMPSRAEGVEEEEEDVYVNLFIYLKLPFVIFVSP